MNVLVEIAKGVFLILRIFFALLSTIVGLASFIVPWRIVPGILTMADSENHDLNEWIICMWGLFMFTIFEIFSLIVFVLTLFTWRNVRMVRKIRKKWKNTCISDLSLHYNYKTRLAVWGQFFSFIRDIPFFIMILLSTAMIWRAPFFYDHLISGWKKGVSGDKRREQIFVDTMIGIADIFLIPVGLLVLLTGYRVRETIQKVKDVDDDTRFQADDFGDELRRFLYRRLVVLVQGGLVVCDFFHLLLLIVACLLVIRLPAIYKALKNMPCESSAFWTICRTNFMFAFRELFALLCYVIMLPFIYRFYLALSKALERCAKQADPRPHCHVTAVVPEFLNKGFKLHITGTKTPDLCSFSNTKIFARDPALWKIVEDKMGSAVATIGKGFLPFKVAVDDKDFEEGKTEFSTTVHFDIKAGKKGIVNGINKIGGMVETKVDVEFGKHEGTLMSMKFRLGSLAEAANDENPGTELDLFEVNDDYDVTDTTSAEILRDAKPIPGELFCDTMAVPAFIEFAYFLSDILALILFLLIHLVPWRAYTMYRSMSLSKEQLQLFLAAKEVKKLRKTLDATEKEIEKSYQMIDTKVKSGMFHTYRVFYWYNTYTYGDNMCEDHKWFVSFVQGIIDTVMKLEKLGSADAAKELRQYALSALTSHYVHIQACREQARFMMSFDPIVKTNVKYYMTNYTFDGAGEWVISLRNQLGVTSFQDPAGTQAKDRAPASQLSVQQAYAESQRVKAHEVKARENSRSALTDITTRLAAELPGLSCKVKPSKKAVFVAVKEFAVDVAAVFCVLFVVLTLYRIPVLWRTMRKTYSFHRTAFSNALEIPYDFLYLLKSIIIILCIRNMFSFPACVLEYTLQERTYEAARKVVDYFFNMAVGDILSLLFRIFSCESLKWVVGGIAVGFFTPGVLVEHLIFGSDSAGCFSGLIVVIVSGWLYGWSGAIVGSLLPDGKTALSFGLYYGVLGGVLLVFLLVSALSSSEIKESVRLTHSRFLRLNWFNGLQMLYAAIEALWAVALVGRLFPSSDLYSFFRAVLLDIDASDGYPLGVYVTMGAMGAYYILVALPIIVMALSSETTIYKHNSWVFCMGLLSQGMQLLITFNLTQLLFCDSRDGFEGGVLTPFSDTIHCYYDTKHITLAAFSTLGFSFYSLTTVMKIPEYTTSHSTMLDIIFVELYEALIRFGIVVMGVLAVATRDSIDATVGVTIGGMLWCIGWTLCYPYVFNVDHVCSVRMYTMWRTACYSMAAASIIALRVNKDSSSIVTFVIFAVLLAGIAAVFIWKMYNMYHEAVIGLEVTPEQVQQDLHSLHGLMVSKGSLARGLSHGQWEAMVSGNTRASKLALCVMQLEHHTKLSHMHPVFLTQRFEWYKDMWQLVDDDDVRRDFYYRLRDSWYFYEFFWGCGCDASPPTASNARIVDSVQDISTLNTLLQRFKNGLVGDDDILCPEPFPANEDEASHLEMEDQEEDEVKEESHENKFDGAPGDAPVAFVQAADDEI
eukprot:TRINITY_DN3851_c2_g1_i1.p1 TRINITY_DN3851_c2_g1~~TRINITY_DN3851_c2_g1_i1.p1  ORF type:complete len:1492 (+),score=343.43 TRINITY_DN3851_c2_g1_i1:58-4533(+)